MPPFSPLAFSRRTGEGARAERSRPGTPERPLYHWHISKTAGSALKRVLVDSFPAGAYLDIPFLSRWDPRSASSGASVVTGHLGAALPALWPGDLATFTILRDPVARAWSHWRFHCWRRDEGDKLPPIAGEPTHLREVLSTPDRCVIEEWQAYSLAGYFFPTISAKAALPLPSAPHEGRPHTVLRGAALREAALSTLDQIDVVGVAERLDETVEALSRFLRRRLSPPAAINENPHKAPMSVDDASLVRRLSPIDRELWAIANHRLDTALATLPALPARPVTTRSWTLTMDQALVGTGWHGRVHTDVGWHRWTGPGTRSVVWPDVTLDGTYRLEIEIVSAGHDDLMHGLRLDVQGRPVEHETHAGAPGVVAVAPVTLTHRCPTDIGITVPRTVRLSGEDGSLGDLAGLAVRAIRLIRIGRHPDDTWRQSSIAW